MPDPTLKCPWGGSTSINGMVYMRGLSGGQRYSPVLVIAEKAAQMILPDAARPLPAIPATAALVVP